ncbi:Na(+)-translocating NADH-quinone reductase subunit A [hydrothermal vent metagenome]|uniref:Na(+)-translocating NADH-quinone reductase subunit A n=1 Tax=hydrothermal vent metagenome TaxID=652676 RepID=A0A3B1CX94_9ZZZZ
MSLFQIKKGKDIKLKGAAEKKIVDISLPKQAAIQPSDFRGMKPRLAVKVDSVVKVGSTILTDKVVEGLKVVSPISGKVVAINRGAKRALLSIVIETDAKQEAESFQKLTRNEIKNISKKSAEKFLMDGGLWPVIRQRPFSKIANPSDKPKSIFIHAMNSEPLASDVDFILEGKEDEFQVGIDIIKSLTDGTVYICTDHGAKSKALTQVNNAEIHQFAGVHPAGNVSTHIHRVDPINKGEHIWYIEAQDVLRIAALFLSGEYSAERVVAVTGEGVKNRIYAKTIVGVPVSVLLQGSNLEGMRCISGSILAGSVIGKDGFVRFYDSQITVIPEGGERKLLGWMDPGVNKYTFSHAFLSAFLPEKEVSLDADENGSHRAIVMNHVYDQYVAIDIMVYFLLKAVISENIEEAEALGILECDEEDFALCTVACPSKIDVGKIIREGLELIEKEG